MEPRGMGRRTHRVQAASGGGWQFGFSPVERVCVMTANAELEVAGAPAQQKAASTKPLKVTDKGERINIRTYRSSDHRGVIDVFVPGLMANAKIPGQCQKFWDNYISYSLSDDLAKIEATYFATGGHFWAAVVEKDDGSEEVVGMVAIERKADSEGELRRMSVKSEYRRYGVGRRLVETLEAWAVEHGFTRIWLSAGYVLEKAHHFYKSLGYRIFKDEVFHEDPLFIMAFFEKTLTPSTQ